MAKKSENQIIQYPPKISVLESELNDFFIFLKNNINDFKMHQNKQFIDIYYISDKMPIKLLNIFNNIRIPFDLLYFKSLHIDKNQKTVDFTFDAHSRCDPKLSEIFIQKILSDTSIKYNIIKTYENELENSSK